MRIEFPNEGSTVGNNALGKTVKQRFCPGYAKANLVIGVPGEKLRRHLRKAISWKSVGILMAEVSG